MLKRRFSCNNKIYDRAISWLLVLLLCLLASSAQASDATQHLNRFFTEVKTFSADFTQRVLDDKGELVQESSGTVKLKRPGRFRWDYAKPLDQLIVADGRNLWIFDAALKQATVKDLNTALGAAPITLLTQLKPFLEEFNVVGSAHHDGLDWVKLTPKVEDTEFDRVEFGLDDTSIRRMRLHDQFDQTTVIRFESPRINMPIPDAVFEFQAPEGVDVIGTPR